MTIPSNYIATPSDFSPRNIGLGTAYKVMHHGIESYLIGTVHNADQKTIQQSCFYRIMEKNISILYSELGIFDVIGSPQISIPEAPHQYQHIKYRYVLDTAIVLEAILRRIPIVALDVSPEKEAEEIAKVKNIDPLYAEKWRMDRTLGSSPKFSAFLNKLRYGRVRSILAVRKYEKLDKPYFFEPREERWAQILIPALLNTHNPICIAVGACHLVGKNSLSDRFKKAGCNVELIHSTNPLDWDRFAPPRELAPRLISSSPITFVSFVEQVWDVAEATNRTLTHKGPHRIKRHQTTEQAEADTNSKRAKLKSCFDSCIARVYRSRTV